MRVAALATLLLHGAAAVVMPRSRSNVVCRMPSLSPLPPALAASDGSHTFTYDSVQRRLPLIIESVIESNAYDAATVGALRGLAGEIAAGAPLMPLAAATDEWAAALAPRLAAGDTWFSAPWFLVENYLYKRMLELTDGPSGGADPFAAQKAASLDGSASALAGMLAAGLAEGEVQMARLVATSLWGNLADLSLSAGAALVSPADASAGASAEAASKMLADDTAGLCASIAAAADKEVIIVLDNCGLELVSDLLLVDGLLRSAAPPLRVTLHAKDRPVFVSDVTEPDLPITLQWLDAQGGGAMAARLTAALNDGRLCITSPPFYTGPSPFWEMPASLVLAYAAASLVITKGDANYRRLLGDLHWAHDTPFGAVCDYFPTALGSLRTCKSGVCVGVEPQVEAAAAAAHPDKWLVGGIYGMVQLKQGE